MLEGKKLEGKEKWVPFPDKEGYELSSFGRVRYVKTGYIIHQWMGSNGFPRVTVRGTEYYLHRLVAQVFVPNPSNLPFVRFREGNIPAASNLYWDVR